MPLDVRRRASDRGTAITFEERPGPVGPRAQLRRELAGLDYEAQLARVRPPAPGPVQFADRQIDSPRIERADNGTVSNTVAWNQLLDDMVARGWLTGAVDNLRDRMSPTMTGRESADDVAARQISAISEIIEAHDMLEAGGRPINIGGATQGPDFINREVKARTQPFDSIRQVGSWLRQEIGDANSQFRTAGIAGCVVLNLMGETTVPDEARPGRTPGHPDKRDESNQTANPPTAETLSLHEREQLLPMLTAGVSGNDSHLVGIIVKDRTHEWYNFTRADTNAAWPF